MERKRQEKKRKQREQEREERKLALLKTFKADLSPYADRLIKDELQEDILNFKDSDRESLISYLQSAAALQNVPALRDLPLPMIDTPTRLVNESNEFLEMQLSKKRRLFVKEKEETSQSSIERRKVQDRKDKLLAMLNNK